MNIKLKIFSSLSIVLLTLFLLINYIHLNLFTYSVFLYSSTFDLCLALLITYVFYGIFNKNFFLNNKLLIAIFSYLHFVTFFLFIIFFNVVIERSLSLYILERLNQTNPLTIIELNENIRNNYFDDMNVIDTRIVEQISSGNITMHDNQIFLTDQGKSLVNFVRMYKKYFLNPNYQKNEKKLP